MKSLVWSLALVMVAGLTGPVAAQQDQADRQRQQDRQNNQPIKEGDMIRLSNALGMPVYDNNDQEIGEINELVLDQDSEIAYAVMTRGGFLGFGDAMYALDWSGLQFKRDEFGSPIAFIQRKADYFDNREGFDQNHWPSEADTTLTEEGADAPAEPATSADNKDRNKANRELPKGYHKASRLVGLEVRNQNNEAIGTVEDVALVAGDVAPAYMAVAYDQTLGLGGKMTAITPDEGKLMVRDNQVFLQAQLDKDNLKNRKTFNSNNYPKPGKVDTYTSENR